jgi:hypothetical protein
MAAQGQLVAGIGPDGNTQTLATDGNGALLAGGAGATQIATGQVSVTTSAGGTLIVAARTGRKSLLIFNEGTTDVRLGVNGVTTSTGVLLTGVKGAGVGIDGAAAVYGIVAAGSQTVSYMEMF